MTADTRNRLLPDIDATIGIPEHRPSGLAVTTPIEVVAPVIGEPPFEPMPDVPAPTLRAAPLARRHRRLLLIADGMALFAAAGLGAALVQMIEPVRVGTIALRHILLVAAAMGLAFHLHGLYRRPAFRLRPSNWWRPWVVARCLPTAALAALGGEVLLFDGDRMTLTAAVAMTAPAILLVPWGRRMVVDRLGPPSVTRILVVGTGKIADRLAARLSRCPDTVLVGAVDNAPVEGRPVLGGLDDLTRLCREKAIDQIIVAFTITPDSEILDRLRLLGGRVPVSVIPRLFELHSWRSEVEELHGLPLMHVPPASLGTGARLTKRVLDVAFAVIALILTLPLALPLALAIKLDSKGPVFFRQERIGRGGREFRIFKYRTMTDDAWELRSSVATRNEVDGPLFKMASDPRVTRLGRILRKTSIDELPQLINVVRGEMSLVGPRPLPTEESRRLDGAALTRFDVAPGLTGLWQVSGRSDLTYADLQHLDSVYVRSWSLMWDLRIILATPGSVLGGRGAY